MKIYIGYLILVFAAAKSVDMTDHESIHNLVQSPGQHIILIYADGCSSCEAFKPIFEKLSDSSIPFYKVERKIYNEKSILGVSPSVPKIFWQDGEETFAFEGPANEKTFSTFLNRIETPFKIYSQEQGDFLIVYTEDSSSLSKLTFLKPFFDGIYYISLSKSELDLPEGSIVYRLNGNYSISSFNLTDTDLSKASLKKELLSEVADLFLRHPGSFTEDKTFVYRAFFNKFVGFFFTNLRFKRLFVTLAAELSHQERNAMPVLIDCSEADSVELKHIFDCKNSGVVVFDENLRGESIKEEGRFNVENILKLIGVKEQIKKRNDENSTKMKLTQEEFESSSPSWRFVAYFVIYTIVFFFVYRKWFNRRESFEIPSVYSYQ